MGVGITIVVYLTQNGMIPLMTKLKVMKDKALKLLDEIEANVSTCCAITMEPDEVLVMIEQLRDEINKL
jgi:hypothetical protein